MRTAIVHYWLVGMRGGEKVVEALCRLLPDADIFTLFYDPSRVSDLIRSRNVTASYLNPLRRYYRSLLPLMPSALESFDLRGYDLVVQQRIRTGQGSADAVADPPPLLLPHSHAVSVGLLSGLHGGLDPQCPETCIYAPLRAQSAPVGFLLRRRAWTISSPTATQCGGEFGKPTGARRRWCIRRSPSSPFKTVRLTTIF